jgi:hypothetical protein
MFDVARSPEFRQRVRILHRDRARNFRPHIGGPAARKAEKEPCSG